MQPTRTQIEEIKRICKNTCLMYNENDLEFINADNTLTLVSAYEHLLKKEKERDVNED